MNKRLRSILFILIPAMLVMISPTLLLAETSTAAAGRQEAFQPVPVTGEEIPPLEDGSPYNYPIISTPRDEVAEPSSPQAVSINVWYGNTQTYGTLGKPQQWVNILGNVTDSTTVTSLAYTLNGGPEQALNIGPADLRRLFGEGDFNIEINYDDLVPGPNTVEIIARVGLTPVTKTITVMNDFVSGKAWPLPYTANWGSMSSILDGAQVVDGLWAVNGGKLVVEEPGYDRGVVLGDVTWTDYEVTVPVKVVSLNTDGWGPPSNGAGVGLLVKWRGHTQVTPGEQPRTGWRRLGALAWYRWQHVGNKASFEILGNGGQRIASRSDEQIQLGETYIFKLSVQSSTFAQRPAHYRFKYWQQGQPEPTGWFMSAQGVGGEPVSGSIMLVAHQAVVEFGNVQVNPLPAGPFTLNTLPTSNGQIIIEPVKPSYQYGEHVRIRALGNTGFALSDWTNSFSGNQNPIDLDITQNVTVGANFASAPAPTLTITSTGSGSVDVSSAPPYRNGEEITLTPKPGSGNIFAGWIGDLNGADSPAVIVLDKSKNITAKFIPGNVNSPVSDDFNACDLNSNVWTFVDPLNDASYLVNGEQLRISVPGGTSHNIWTDGNKSVRMMQPTQNGPFEIIVKFDSLLTSRYQMQGILVQKDDQNFLRFETHHDGTGVRIFAAEFTNGVPKTKILDFAVAATPPYLRVTRVDGLWSFSYSSNGTTWKSAGSFEHDLTVTSTGVFAANHARTGELAPAFTALVDYYFNSLSPIVPEDPVNVGQFTINVNTVGNGTVTRDPSKATYGCGEPVTLTAQPANGWRFSGWSGDLTGSVPIQQLNMTRNYQVTATFVEQGGQDGFSLYMPVAIR